MVGLLPIILGAIQQEGGGIVYGQHIEFEWFKISRKIGESAGDNQMAASELTDQTFGLGQRLVCVEVV